MMCPSVIGYAAQAVLTVSEYVLSVVPGGVTTIGERWTRSEGRWHDAIHTSRV